MKLKSLATAIAAGGLLAAAGPSSAVTCEALTTVAGWILQGSTCTDADGDSTWNFVSSSLPANTLFIFSETQGAGFDVYNLTFGFPGGLETAGGTIAFTATGTAAEPFDAADYDSTVTEPTGVSGTKTTAAIAPVGLSLVSNDGAHVPLTGETPFASTLSIAVADHIDAIPAGTVFNAITNSFQVGSATKIPEPATLLLMGAALAGAGFARRRKQD